MEPYKIVVATAANNWDHEEIGTATDSDIAALMVEGLINGYARKIDITLRYNATTYGIAGGVIAGIELYDYKTDEVQAVVGYIDNDEYEEDENTCAVCLDDYASSETRWIDGFRPRDSERVVSGYICDDCERAGER